MSVTADRDDRIGIGIGIACRNGSAARPGIIGAISANAGYLLVLRNLRQQTRQRWRIADGIRRDFDSPDNERSRVDPQMHRAPLPAAGGSMLTRLPPTFSCHFNAGAVDQDDHRPDFTSYCRGSGKLGSSDPKSLPKLPSISRAKPEGARRMHTS